MKEKKFTFRESFATAVKAMDDKQAGKFIKGVCGYVFDGTAMESKDTALQVMFSLVKNVLEEEQKNREYGRLGGIKSAQLRKNNDCALRMFAEAKLDRFSLDELVGLLNDLDISLDENSVAKTDKK